MKTYNVTVTTLFKLKFKIEADSPQEAEKKAQEIDLQKIDETAYEQGVTDILGYEADAEPVIDLFDQPELIPNSVKEILDAEVWGESYEDCNRLNNKLNTIGYGIDWALDAIPYNLRKL